AFHVTGVQTCALPISLARDREPDARVVVPAERVPVVALLRDAVLRDELLRDELLRDAVLRDELLRDELLRDELLRDELLRDELLRDELLRDELLRVEVARARVDVVRAGREVFFGASGSLYLSTGPEMLVVRPQTCQ